MPAKKYFWTPFGVLHLLKGDFVNMALTRHVICNEDKIQNIKMMQAKPYY